MPHLRAVTSRFSTFVSSKLGRCSACMRSASAGTALAWGAVALTLLASDQRVVAAFALAVAAAFTVLAAAHAIAFALRIARSEPGCGTCGHAREAHAVDGPSRMSRRAFFGIAAAGGAALVYALTQRASIAEALGKCKPNFRVGQVIGQGVDGCNFTYGVDVTCDCTGTCDKGADGQRPPCDRDNTSPLTYAWTLTVQQGAAAISGAATNSTVVVNVTTSPAKYTLQVTVGGCKCCCRGTADCRTAAAAASKPKQFSVSC